MRAALYARVSTKQQSTDPQLRELRAYIERRGFTIAGEYVDEGISGAKDKRPALSRLMADAKLRHFDAVLVYKWDRFARSVLHLATALKEFEALGIEFISTTEGTDTTTPQGRMIFGIFSAIAEFERALITERVTSGLANTRERLAKTGPFRKANGHLVTCANRPREYTTEEIKAALVKTNGSARAAAKLLKCSSFTIRYRLKQEAKNARPSVEVASAVEETQLGPSGEAQPPTSDHDGE